MEIAIAEHVAREVRAEIARRRLTQAEVAARLGHSQAWLSRRLSGTTPITLADLDAIASALETPTSHFTAERASA